MTATTSEGPLPAVYQTLYAPAIVSGTYAIAGGTVTLDDSAKTFTAHVDIQTRMVSLEVPNADTVVTDGWYGWSTSYVRSGAKVTLADPSNNILGLPVSVAVHGETLTMTVSGITFTLVKQ